MSSSKKHARSACAALAALVLAAACGFETSTNLDPALTKSLAQLPFSSGSSVVWGPETFTRGEGRPHTETRIVPTVGFQSEMKLRVVNGGGSRRTRVTRATIWIDGRRVLTRRNFRRSIEEFVVPFMSDGEVTLEVRIGGRRGTSLTLSLLGDPTLPPPVAHYTFDSCDGTDTSERGLHVQPFGDPKCVEGPSGSAMSFEGDDYFRRTGVDLALSDFSAAFFVRGAPLAPDPRRQPFAVHTGGGGINQGDGALTLWYSEAGGTANLRGGFTAEDGQFIDDGAFPDWGPDAEFPVGTWHHVVYQRANGVQQAFLDGRLVDEAPDRAFHGLTLTLQGGLIDIGAPSFWNGGWTQNGRDQSKWKGGLDDVRFYDTALTADQIGLLCAPLPSC